MCGKLEEALLGKHNAALTWEHAYLELPESPEFKVQDDYPSVEQILPECDSPIEQVRI